MWIRMVLVVGIEGHKECRRSCHQEVAWKGVVGNNAGDDGVWELLLGQQH